RRVRPRGADRQRRGGFHAGRRVVPRTEGPGVTGGGRGATVPRPADRLREVPSSPAGEVEPGRLLRHGVVLHARAGDGPAAAEEGEEGREAGGPEAGVGEDGQGVRRGEPADEEVGAADRPG